MTKLLTVGKHKITGNPVFIETALKGLKCNAVCPSCGRNLEARQGNSNDWHFAHDDTNTGRTACTAPYETALHYLSKWIIKRGFRIKLPDGKYFVYNQATVEIVIDRFRIDVHLANTNSNQVLLVEIVVGHALDNQKILELNHLNYRVLEIDLSEYEGTLAEAAMITLLLDTTYGKKMHKPRVALPSVPIAKFNPFPLLVAAAMFVIGYLVFGMPKKRR